MDNENVLNGFMDGFAKVAEDAGFHGQDIQGLMELSLDLAQSVKHPQAFGAGFIEAVKQGV